MENNRKKVFLNRLVILIVRIYQLLISPVLGKHCRFYPSCSNYFIEAVDKFGVVKGIGLFFNRMARCHPFHPGGYDPVPEGNNK